MKNLFLAASILSILGCNQVHDESSRVTNSKADPQKQQTTALKQKENHNNFTVKTTSKDSAMIDVIVINQNPELKYGCEVTSLAMLLHHAGVKTDKMELYREVKKETDPLIRKKNRDILHWGNPEYGHVGDMTGRKAGTTVFDRPMALLINQKLPDRAVNLTGQPFKRILEHVGNGYPVVVWTTLDYGLPQKWEAWYHGKEIVKVPLDLHAVVLVGYDNQFVYLNDPLSVRKKVRVNKNRFMASWEALGSRAVSYTD